ncbi:hypothetical protein DNK06_23065 [Pseudomonas daroniae]|uniref:Uncharacterized protein n=1 Tax=Phytopseudomonas daroniae TaxID=2487519 RepID=A0A4Q9QGL0_9GAMM|nr:MULTISPECIES: hypothetical protein [Pseudomonas]TBU72010.1 hypothetical protein DNK06_23065 [Pseudomonas daroniae]TBU75854.1 hypothetical protein DNK31_22805 [Pseudomonas sp. FRB 228]TBU77353.1 hypothetical protein DNK10_07585 [Pseudomonas daroniae]TBU87130.1 hypothetical protein DNJ99_22685 [Pseudomonas daroniae]
MDYRDVLEMQKTAKRFKRLAVWGLAILGCILLFGGSRWHLTGAPPNPISVEMMKDYVRGAGADPESLILSNHHGTCGTFTYIARDGERSAPLGFVAIPGKGVSLSLFSAEWDKSPCAGPRSYTLHR